MRRLVFMLLVLTTPLLGQAQAVAEANFQVKFNATRPNPSCGVNIPSGEINFGDVEIPWAGTANYSATMAAEILYTNTTSITLSINPSTSFSYDGGNITGSLSVPASSSVSGSSTQQTLNVTVSGSATVDSNTAPGLYDSVTRTLDAACVN